MPGSASLFHMHALLESDYAILRYIFQFFALCRGPKWGHDTMPPPSKYPPGCACFNGHSILVTAWNHSTCIFKRCGLLILFFIKIFIYDKIFKYISVVLRCILVARKVNFTGFSTGLTGRSKNLDPTGNPTGFHLWPGITWTSLTSAL